MPLAQLLHNLFSLGDKTSTALASAEEIDSAHNPDNTGTADSLTADYRTAYSGKAKGKPRDAIFLSLKQGNSYHTSPVFSTSLGARTSNRVLEPKLSCYALMELVKQETRPLTIQLFLTAVNTT